MGWDELKDNLDVEFRQEAEKLLSEAKEKEKEILEEAQKQVAKNRQELLQQAQKEAARQKEEIISAGRISARAKIRAETIAVIDEIYKELREKVLKDAGLLKKIFENFLSENMMEGASVEVSPNVAKIVKIPAKVNKELSNPIVIKKGNIEARFDWDEFFEKFRQSSIGKVMRMI